MGGTARNMIDLAFFILQIQTWRGAGEVQTDLRRSRRSPDGLEEEQEKF